MAQTTEQSTPVIIGVDTHKDNHVAVAINVLGVRLDDCIVPTTRDGYQALLEWSDTFSKVVSFGVEGTGSYGRGLTRFLLRQGFTVIEVGCPSHGNSRRLQGKDDALDAEQAAREVLSGKATAIPKATDGTVEMLRLIKVAKDTAVKAQTQVLVSLKATLVTADEELREQLEPLSTPKLVDACARLEVGTLNNPASTMRYALATMAKRWLQLTEEIEIHTQYLNDLTHEVAPELVQSIGVGPDTAAQMLITVGQNAYRIRSEAAFSKMCGVCPIPASSGRTQRHRLNRGGNRQANAALFRVVLVRMRWHEPTKVYVARRTTEGLSKREIIRCLKRYVAREIYQILREIFPAAEKAIP